MEERTSQIWSTNQDLVAGAPPVCDEGVSWLVVEDVVDDSRDRASDSTADYDIDLFPKLIAFGSAQVDFDHDRRCPVVHSDVPP